ncbi:MAG: hypothetical protein SGILL_010027, partial [Bacillariaceae sp.]
SAFLLFATSYRWATQKVSSPRDRILMGMSFLDLFSSMSAILGPTVSPADTDDMIHAYGNQATCSMQAFWSQLGAGVPLYNAMLSIYYTMTIVFMMQDVTIRKYVEWFFHALPLGFAFSTAIAGVVLEIYNSNGKFCWVDDKPLHCSFDPEVECERGENAYQFVLPFAGYPLIFGFLVVTVCMIMICVSFSRRSKVLSDFSSTKDVNKIVSAVFVQALLFILAFLLTYVWGFAIKVMRYTGKEPHFSLRVLHKIFFPLQGFWNVLIFIRPTYVRIRKQMQQEKGKRWWCGCCFQILWRALREESVAYVPPARQQRSSILLAAVQKSITASAKRRRSGSSFDGMRGSSSFDAMPGSTEEMAGSELHSDVESLGSEDDNVCEARAAELAHYMSTAGANAEGAMDILTNSDTSKTTNSTAPTEEDEGSS